MALFNLQSGGKRCFKMCASISRNTHYSVKDQNTHGNTLYSGLYGYLWVSDNMSIKEKSLVQWFSTNIVFFYIYKTKY